MKTAGLNEFILLLDVPPVLTLTLFFLFFVSFWHLVAVVVICLKEHLISGPSSSQLGMRLLTFKLFVCVCV